MKPIRFVVLLSGLIFFLSGCNKEKLTNAQCSDLEAALIADDAQSVQVSLGDLISRYSKTNLNRLTESVSDNCEVTASFDCYDCIKTNPAMTEVTFSFRHQGTTVTKVVDISSDNNNKMKIVNVH